jgi:hypothetical protein
LSTPELVAAAKCRVVAIARRLAFCDLHVRLLRPGSRDRVSLVWQRGNPLAGKDADNALFVWQQGVRNPTEQCVPEESQCSASEIEKCLLPDMFDFYGWCPDDHEMRAVGRCENGVWTTTDISESEAEAELAREKPRRLWVERDSRSLQVRRNRSQSILGSFDEDDLPAEITLSVEADFVPVRDVDNEKSDLIDGVIGEIRCP